MMNDRMKQFAEGDLEAFEAVFREFQGRVYGWIVRLVREPATAEDLTIETFWRIYKSRGRFDTRLDFGAWAYRIATNVALSHLRQRPPMDQLDGDVPQAVRVNPAEQGEKRESIRRALLSLPPRFQLVATMALIEQRSHQEIGAALEISTGTVKSRLFRATRLLRRKLEQMGVTR
jgi:RNA polymerase sigma-70 factor (ECF subfamily)